MKTNRMINCVAWLLLGCILTACHPKTKPTPPIPEGAMVYICKENLAENWERFSSTRLFQDLLKLDLWQDPAIRNRLEAIKTRLETDGRESGIPLNKQTLMTFLGNRVDIALYPGFPYVNAIMIMDLDDKATAVRVLDTVHKELNTSEIKTHRFKNFDLTFLPIQNSTNLVYFFRDNQLICATSLDLAKNAASVIRRELDNFSSTEQFQRAQNLVQDYDGRILVDMTQLRSIMQKVMSRKGMDQEYSTEYIDKVIVGVDLTETGFEAVSNIMTVEDLPLTEVLENGLDASLVNWIPANTIGASAASVNWPALMELQKRDVIQAGSRDSKTYWLDFITAFKSKTSIDLEQELQPILGRGIFIAFHNLNSQGMFPFPQLVAGINITDRETALKTMEKIERMIEAKLAEKHVEFQTADFENLTYRHIPLPLGPNLAPGYVITENLILFSTSLDGVKESWDAFNSRSENLMQADRFQLRDSIQRGQLAGFQYLNIEELAGSLANLVNSYRIFFPKDLNPDHVKSALNAIGNIQEYTAAVSVAEKKFNNRFTLKIR